ncbi:MAG: hypothetical protein ACK58L_04165, partial [Planctomycetota bacterium]
TVTRATNNGNVSAYVAAGSTLDVDGDISIGAQNTTRQVADSSSDAFGLIAVGVTKATAVASTETRAYLDGGVTGVNGVKIDAGSLSITATGNDDNYAESTAGAGGLGVGASASNTTINTSIVTAEVRDGSAGRGIVLSERGSGQFTLSATHTAKFNAKMETNAAGFISGAGITTTHSISPTVTAAVRDGVSIRALGAEMRANSIVSKPELSANLDGSARALVSGATATSTTTLTLNTVVSVGSSQITIIGQPSNEAVLVLAASNRIDADEKVNFEAAGLGAGVSVDTTIQALVNVARVDIGANARLVAPGRIEMSARGGADVDIQANAEANGGVGVVAGTSTVDLRPVNQVNIGAGARVLAAGDIWLSAGRSGNFESDWYVLESRLDSYSSAAIPVDVIDANTFVVQNNTISVADGALLQTAGEARLHAERLGVSNLRVGAAGHSWAANLFSVPSEFEKGDLLAEAHGLVIVDGTVETGIDRKQSLRLTAWDNGGTYGGVTYAPRIAGYVSTEGVPESAVATARSGNNIGAVSFVLVYDGVEKTVNVAAKSNATSIADLVAHIQTAVNTALGGAGKVVVTSDSNGVIGFDLPDVTLAGQSAAETVLAAARFGTNQLNAVSFQLVYDGVARTINVGAKGAGTLEQLRQHVQAAVDAALTSARVANAGDVNVVIGSGNSLKFEIGLLANTWHTLGLFEPGFTTEIVSVRSQLISQLEFARAQIVLYPANTTLVNFYNSEINRINAELDELGLIDAEAATNGGFVAAIEKNALGVVINA